MSCISEGWYVRFTVLALQVTPAGYSKVFPDKLTNVDPKIAQSKGNKTAGRTILSQIANCA